MFKLKMFFCSVVASAAMFAYSDKYDDTEITLQAMYTYGDLKVPSAGPYGFQDTGIGPKDNSETGMNAFQVCTNYVHDNNNLMVVVLTKNNCRQCRLLCAGINVAASAAAYTWTHKSTVNCAFRGTDNATVDAFNFVKNKFGLQDPCHFIGCYGLCQDGTEYVQQWNWTANYLYQGSYILNFTEFSSWKINHGNTYEVFANQHKKSEPVQPEESTVTKNSMLNPYFIGERNYYQLGTWTMDLNAATNWTKNNNSYVMCVSGCSTTDSKTRSFYNQVLSTPSFMNMVSNRYISLVLLEKQDSDGYGLLTHNHKDSDCYISRKGLRTYSTTARHSSDTRTYSAQEMQDMLNQWNDWLGTSLYDMDVVMLRSDGTVFGRLNPYFTYNSSSKTYTFDRDENISRIQELLYEASDTTEEGNGSASTVLSIPFGQEIEGNTLAISDTNDWFRVIGWKYPGRTVGFRLTSCASNSIANPRIDVIVNGRKQESATGYYTFNTLDVATNAVFIRVSAYGNPETDRSTKVNGNSRFEYTIKSHYME